MRTRVRDLITGRFGELRHEPLPRRLRAVRDGTTVVDSTRAVLVWEPRRILPCYAVPAADIHVDLRPADPLPPVPDDLGVRMPELSEHLHLLPGSRSARTPPGMGRSFLADGSELTTDMARIVVKPDGAVRTAFPFSSAHPN